MDALRLLTRSTKLKVGQKATGSNTSLPSEGRQKAPSIDINPKKRKRNEDDDDSRDLTPDEVRHIQSEHKIRIVDLRKLHKASSKRTKKQQKEYARLFPQPLTRFGQLKSRYSISDALQRNISAQAYYEPSEVQVAALPVLLSEADHEPDLLTVAPTGSGKTMAFLIPTIEKIRREHKNSKERHVRCIVLAPTKELVSQIVNEGRKLCANTGITVTAMRKGMRLIDDANGEADRNPGSDSEEEEEEDEGDRQANASSTFVKTDILVSTPLSIVHAVGSASLPNITTLVLDEADVLLDPLFRDQTLSIWSACTSPSLRVSLWSATIGSNIEELAISTISSRRKRLSIAHKPPLYRIIIGLKDSSLPSITHKLIYAATEPGKLLGLRQLLRPSRPAQSTANTTTTSSSETPQPQLRPPFLIFTQTISRATALFTELQYDIPTPKTGPSSSPPIPRIALLHASLPTSQRSQIMTRFRAGHIWILITTDLLSRGVDFRGVNGVVNYDIPTTAASYIHRAGRTGRAGREGGVCVTLYTREDVKYLKAIATVIKASEGAAAAGSTNDSTGKDSGGQQSAAAAGIPTWLMHALPELTKNDRKELKQRGVETRRAIKESDDAEERKRKRKSRIGTKSGWEKREENRRVGMVQGSRARKRREEDAGSDLDGGDANGDGGDDVDGFEGFD